MSTKPQTKSATTTPVTQLSHCPPETVQELYYHLGFLRGTGYEHATRMTELFNKIVVTYTEVATS